MKKIIYSLNLYIFENNVLFSCSTQKYIKKLHYLCTGKLKTKFYLKKKI